MTNRQQNQDGYKNTIIIAGQIAIIIAWLAAIYIPALLINENFLNLEGVRPWNLSFLFFGFIFFILFFVRIIDQMHRGVLVRLGIPLKEISPGPYFKYPFLDEIKPFSLEPHEEKVGFEEEEEENGNKKFIDLYTADGKYIQAKIVLLWRVNSPMKYFMNQRIAEDGRTIKTFIISAARKYTAEKTMEEILKNGKIDLPDKIKTELVGEVRGIIFEEGIFQQWGIEFISTRVFDLDPIPEIKEEMKKRSEAEYQRDKTIIDAEAQAKKTVLEAEAQAKKTVLEAEAEQKKRIALAEALRQEGFAEADVSAKEIEKQIEAQIKTLGLSKDEAINYNITVKMITDALSKANITTFDISGIAKIAVEIIKSIKEIK